MGERSTTQRTCSCSLCDACAAELRRVAVKEAREWAAGEIEPLRRELRNAQARARMAYKSAVVATSLKRCRKAVWTALFGEVP